MYKFALAAKYLVKRRIAYFAMLAVALCVFIVVIVLTVMVGLVREIKQKNHDFVSDCIVATESLVGFPYYEDFVKLLENADFVYAVSPVVKSYALLSPQDTNDTNMGVEVIGIDPLRHERATGFSRTLSYREDDVAKAFEPMYDPNLPGCILGIDIALRRDARSRYFYEPKPPRISLSVSCFPLTVTGALAKAGTTLVNTQTFYYSDHSHTGLARVDGSTIYLPFERLQMLCGMDSPVKRASAVHIKFAPGVKLEHGSEKVASLWRRFKADKTGLEYANLLDTVTVQDWKIYRRESIAPMEKELTIISVMFAFVTITTVFIVFVVFYMIISHKSKDIGILKSIGASNAGVVQLFSQFAMLVGLIGSIVGTLTGCLFLKNINRIENQLFERFGFQLWDRTIFAIGDIPNQIDFGVLTLIMCSAILACLIGALIPTIQAARLRPVDILRVGQL
jgi:lipoprotein-releasing system permease protein